MVGLFHIGDRQTPLVLTEGFEPPTYGLRVRSSTAELSKRMVRAVGLEPTEPWA